MNDDERREYLRHNYLLRRPSAWGKSVIPIGHKVRAGLGYPPTSKLMPGLGRPWTELGTTTGRPKATR